MVREKFGIKEEVKEWPLLCEIDKSTNTCTLGCTSPAHWICRSPVCQMSTAPDTTTNNPNKYTSRLDPPKNNQEKRMCLIILLRMESL